MSIGQIKLKSAIVPVAPKYKGKNVNNLVIHCAIKEVIGLFSQTFKYLDYLPSEYTVLGVENYWCLILSFISDFAYLIVLFDYTQKYGTHSKLLYINVFLRLVGSILYH